ncbi:hypothetical protein NC651_007607 [Populus alba x Populus x berolinensis]|nr:hypothetical protein NC651_007607 [Populus alba x Populus x berolinensis]
MSNYILDIEDCGGGCCCCDGGCHLEGCGASYSAFKRFVYIVCMSGGGSKTNDDDSSGSSCCSGGSMKQETLQWWKKQATGKKKEGAESKHASSACTQGPISPKSSHGNQKHASSPTKLESPHSFKGWSVSMSVRFYVLRLGEEATCNRSCTARIPGDLTSLAAHQVTRQVPPVIPSSLGRLALFPSCSASRRVTMAVYRHRSCLTS